MKCEDFLAAFESKNLWRRWRARAHAANCQNCAETTMMAGELHRELSQVEPLSRALRQTWIQTAENAVHARPLSPQPRRRYRYVAFIGAAAAIVMATIGLLIWNGTGQPAVSSKAWANKVGVDEKTPSQRMSPSLMSDTPGELQDILARVDALQREIQVTAQQAELLDARRQADQMIATYSRW